MPFGLQGAPATFQRMMDQLLKGLEDFAAAYLDDLVIYSSSWGEHLDHIRQVMDCFRGAGLTAKPRKCQFTMAQCSYLGHVVGNGAVRPEKSKLDAITSFQQPKTKKEVRAFLGLTGYYRRFILDFATIQGRRSRCGRCGVCRTNILLTDGSTAAPVHCWVAEFHLLTVTLHCTILTRRSRFA